MTLQPLYQIWYLSFATLGFSYAALTLFNLFVILAESLTNLTELNASVKHYERRKQNSRAEIDRGSDQS